MDMQTHIKLKKIAEGVARTPMEIALANAFKKAVRLPQPKKAVAPKAPAPYRYQVQEERS